MCLDIYFHSLLWKRGFYFVIMPVNLIKRFSRVPQQLLAWSERKLIAIKAMPRKDKSLGDTVHQISSGLFSFFRE